MATETRMQPPRILLTGATDGIGLALSHALAKRGARLLLHGRSKAKLADCQALFPEAICLRADFARMSEVRAMGTALQADPEGLDVIIANAGVFMTERVITEDGFETTFQVNHLAHLCLILDVLPRLRSGGRILVVASTSHEKVKSVDLENLDGSRGFEGYPAYGLAKLAQVGTALELAPRLAERDISILALHPGSILTKLQVAGWGGGGNPDPAPAVDRILALALEDPAPPSGAWLVDGQPRDPNPLLLDPQFRRALWQRSLAMVGGQDASGSAVALD
jgi:NAD(P)-dependent dehydrogenase (short-subunit alcohol dehydrogenase family)